MKKGNRPTNRKSHKSLKYLYKFKTTQKKPVSHKRHRKNQQQMRNQRLKLKHQLL
jgi:hypothetical protein